MSFGLATIKKICENRIMIGKYYWFFVINNLVSSLGNNWNHSNILDLR